MIIRLEVPESCAPCTLWPIPDEDPLKLPASPANGLDITDERNDCPGLFPKDEVLLDTQGIDCETPTDVAKVGIEALKFCNALTGIYILEDDESIGPLLVVIIPPDVVGWRPVY